MYLKDENAPTQQFSSLKYVFILFFETNQVLKYTFKDTNLESCRHQHKNKWLFCTKKQV